MLDMIELFNTALAVLLTAAYAYQLFFLVYGLVNRRRQDKQMARTLNRYGVIICARNEAGVIGELIANETFHYIQPHHNKLILDNLWALGEAVRHQQVVEIEYTRLKDHELVKRRVQPVGIMFSEYYFYLTAFLEDKSHFENPDDLFPTIYRVDRIAAFKVLDEHFRVPYRDRFEEGEFRKRVQFMYGGRLQHIKFRYTGPSIEAVLDRLPTARILDQDNEGWTVEAEVFGKGIEMWVRSQGEYISLQEN